jgi:hypothetical protein
VGLVAQARWYDPTRILAVWRSNGGEAASLQHIFVSTPRFSSRTSPGSARPLRLVPLTASVAAEPQPHIGRRQCFNLRHPHPSPHLISFTAALPKSFYIQSSRASSFFPKQWPASDGPDAPESRWTTAAVAHPCQHQAAAAHSLGYKWVAMLH